MNTDKNGEAMFLKFQIGVHLFLSEVEKLKC